MQQEGCSSTVMYGSMLMSHCCHWFSREEIVNACGIDDFHDGVNYTRTACVIAVSKARDMFEPFLHQVRLPL